MAPGARSKLGAPMFEPEVFRNKMHCIEESTCDIVGTWNLELGTFRRPHSHLALPAVIRRPDNCAPFPPRRYALNVSQFLAWGMLLQKVGETSVNNWEISYGLEFLFLNLVRTTLTLKCLYNINLKTTRSVFCVAGRCFRSTNLKYLVLISVYSCTYCFSWSTYLTKHYNTNENKYNLDNICRKEVAHTRSWSPHNLRAAYSSTKHAALSYFSLKRTKSR